MPASDSAPQSIPSDAPWRDQVHPGMSRISSLAQRVPTVSHVYTRAWIALEDTPTWGEETPQRAVQRCMVTPLPDCASPDSLAFSPAPGSPPRQTAAKNLLLGSVLVVLGFFMMLYPYDTTRFAVISVGVFLMVSGVASLLADGLPAGSVGELRWHAVTSACQIILGAYMLEDYRVAPMLLVVVAAVWIVAKGFVREVVVQSSVVAVEMVLLAQKWNNLPGFLLGYDFAMFGACVAMHGASVFRGAGAPSRDSDPLIPQHLPPPYSA